MYGLKLDLDYVFFSLFNIVFDIFVVAGDGAADSVHILFSLSFKVKPDWFVLQLFAPMPPPHLRG